MVTTEDQRGDGSPDDVPWRMPGSARCRDLVAVVMRGVWDFDGYVVSINPGHQIVLGWSLQELSSAPSWEFVHPGEQDWTKRCRHRLRARAQALFGVQPRILGRDGTYRWTRWNARAVPHQQRVYADGVEITDAHRRQSSPPALVGCWEWHLPTDTRTWSEEMFHLYGLPAQTRITRDAVLARIHPADRDPVQEAIQRSLTRVAPFTVDHRVQRPCGRCHVLHCAGRVITDEHGTPHRVRGITHHAVCSDRGAR